MPALAAPAQPQAPSKPLFERQTSCTLPSGYSPAVVSKLPDPFTKADGTKVTTMADWTCRQQELSLLQQQYEYGTIPPKPSTFTATLSNNTLTMTAGEAGKSISFSVTISKPSGAGPFPAIIAYGAPSIPVPNTVATIIFNNDDIAAQTDASSRGQGKFYTLYGASHPAGAMAAWAWGVSRIIDGLEANPSANIDLKRIGVTGCSRNGKGAFVAGAFEPRICLTIPQESGAGGAACWRVSDALHDSGANIQTAGEIIGENVWFGTAFDAYATNTSSLPHDHHELAALVAPRGLYVIENDIDWLGPGSTNVCMRAGRLVYKAVGAQDHMGFSQAAAHTHCAFPSSQQGELAAFIDKFLLNRNASTNVEEGTVAFNLTDWVDWTLPMLSSQV
ncbi:MAG: carbohydrate-binding module 1 [Stictis urceolatum]|nr:carbohydrate-binding module 1 [Stictis urceolata]